MKRSLRARVLLALSVAGSLLLLAALGVRAAFCPRLGGRAELAGLGAQVDVRFDALAIPTIRARSLADAHAALGYVTARERLAQMDLLRRKSAGTLAAVLGPELLESDSLQRHYGMAQVAEAVVARLPEDQRAALEAYARGVNAYLESAPILPFEFSVLDYRPAPWRASDSVLVVLGMFQVLSDSEALERSRTIVARHAPAEVAAFLFAEDDPYTRALLQERSAGRVPAVPFLAAQRSSRRLSARAGEAPVGSNGWAIAGSRTRDGRALVANDMHLELGLPNVWYRAQLEVGATRLMGLTLPGVPLLIAGSNGKVAWGLTNVEADVLDLVEIEQVDAARYQSERGPQPFTLRQERVEVRGQAPVNLTVRETVWGPVLPRTLLGRPVALRWSALDPAAVDLGLLGLSSARDVREAVEVLNRAGMPPLNALLADSGGEIAWTVTGRYPRRRGFTGAESSSFADGKRGWEGYLEPSELPRRLSPRAGFVVNANQRMTATGEPSLGHDYVYGYRAYRIQQRLAGLAASSERDSLSLQLDTRSEPFELYRRVALAALERLKSRSGLREQARAALAAWDGRAERSSRGFALLRGLRRELVERLYAAWLGPAATVEPGFELDFADVDAPLTRALERDDEAPFRAFPGGRDQLVLAAIDAAGAALAAAHGARALPSLRWGEVSKVQLNHPLSALPGLGLLLDMEARELAGCGLCVRMNAGTLGASERMVVSPSRESDGILHMPGGQSGSPFSPHYGDQQSAWVEGRPLPFLAGAEVERLTLLPVTKD